MRSSTSGMSYAVGDPDLLLMNVNSPGDLELARREARR